MTTERDALAAALTQGQEGGNPPHAVGPTTRDWWQDVAGRAIPFLHAAGWRLVNDAEPEPEASASEPGSSGEPLSPSTTGRADAHGGSGLAEQILAIEAAAAEPYRTALERIEAHMVKELERLRAVPMPTSTNIRKREYLNDLLALIPAALLRREEERPPLLPDDDTAVERLAAAIAAAGLTPLLHNGFALELREAVIAIVARLREGGQRE